MTGLRAALGFLTILPGAPKDRSAGLSKAPVWFPVVGLILGVIVAALDWLLHVGYLMLRTGAAPVAEQLRFLLSQFDGVPFRLAIEQGGDSPTMYGLIEYQEAPFLLEGVVLAGVLAVLTRGLHLDGFMDTCDALGGGHDRERRLEILRDPHVGAFAVIGAVFLLVIKCSALAALPSESRSWTLVVVLCVSRWAVLVVMGRFPYARREGLGTPFVRDAGATRVMIAGLAVAGSVAVALAGSLGLVLVGAAGLVAWALGAWAARLLGGVTGDIYGAVVETSEVAMLVLAVLFTLGEPGALRPPLLSFM